MSSVIASLVKTQLLQIDPCQRPASESSRALENDNQPIKESTVILSNVQPGSIVAIWLGEETSSLKTILHEYLSDEDVTLLFFSAAEQLWHWLNVNSSVILASLLIQMKNNLQETVSRSHAHKNVRSIVIRCRKDELVIRNV
ncbi:hypothetical protein I4U23_020376 [Adineta vaga]|nr:hypothetical protein I4U23_020376 [Adineta vaga]